MFEHNFSMDALLMVLKESKPKLPLSKGKHNLF